MKKIIKKIFVLTLIIMTSITTEVLTVNAEGTEMPKLEAKAACSLSSSTGNIIYEKNKDTKMVPASTTKMLTALLVAEKIDMNQMVTIDKESAEVEESSIALKEGEKISVKDLFYALLLHSANDAAVALAKATAGTTDEFVKMMNDRAKAIGAVNSNFVNPNGIKANNHYSTAYDLALIAKEAFSNELVRKASGTVEYTTSKTNKTDERTFKNKNELVRDDKEIEVDGKKQKSKYEGVFAGKTGTWDDNESSIAVALDSKGVELIGVILDSTQKERYSDIFKLLKYTEDNAPRYKMFSKGDVFGSAFIKHGETCFIDAVAKSDGYIKYPEGVSENLLKTEAVFDDVEAPIKQGDRLGEVEIRLEDDVIAKVDLVSNEDVEEGWFPSYIGISNNVFIIICSVIGVIVILVVLLLIIRKKQIKKNKRARQKRLERYVREKRMLEEDRKQRDWKI